ncbi:type 1 glutamine amidotransferase [Dongia soli]|uniref:Type 1 glutamine amidotransferase n=1 Tax=Dongia soli TaxID=600628 RepID=A0ABU5E7E4_9PROT|nr:type 1 glutamine amidotransferase [Dongia soli]MDY0881781.1 type 1 glutamine amidotransferase [Dongia soli]
MRFLVFQHMACEHPGILRDFLAADGIAWDAVELDEGASIPSLGNYDALWVMGGPMDVWEEDQHPWLVAEKQAIREAVQQRGLPYLGLCLGHQLLAAAFGGDVGKMAKPEVGIFDVTLTEAGGADPIFAGMAKSQQALQWHGAEVQVPPPGAVILAQSPLCPIQAMRVGNRAYGLQYHVELTSETVREWGAVPTYACALDESLGVGSMPRLDAEARAKMPAFNRAARQIYDNFMRMAFARV